jgi:hypothetical protein
LINLKTVVPTPNGSVDDVAGKADESPEEQQLPASGETVKEILHKTKA